MRIIKIGKDLQEGDKICYKNSNYTDEDNWIKIIDVKKTTQSIQDVSGKWSIQDDGRPKSIGFAWVYDGSFCRKMSLEEIEEYYVIIKQ